MKQQFLELSARIGANHLLVQGAGGNTSLKAGDTLFVKASGTWLSQALHPSIFVEMTTAGLLDCLEQGSEEFSNFLLESSTQQVAKLRPSIECLLHAVMPQRVVLHVHSISTITHVVQKAGEAEITRRLTGLDFAWVPYARPGLPLAQWIARNIKKIPQILVLQNHGLVIAGETVTEAEALLEECERRLVLSAESLASGDRSQQEEFAKRWGLRLPRFQEAHTLACAEEAQAFLAAGILYPDQAVFLGPSFVSTGPGGDVATILAERQASWGSLPPCLIVSGVGVFLTEAARRGSDEMLLCHALILSRTVPGASYRSLSTEQILELIDWDAEKYRQSLNAV